MATLVTGTIGAVVGFFIGGPSGAAWGWSIGAAVGAVVFAPKGPDIQGPRLNDLKTQTSTYGQPIPRVKGEIRTAGNVIWSTDLVETAHTQDSGGKGGGGGGSSTSYTYAANFATALCEGPVCAVNRIWANGKVIYDAGANSVTVASNGNFWHDLFAGTYIATGASPNIRIYLGTEDQMPDSLIEAHVGAGLTPAYRGLCYIVFEDFQLENYGNQIPNITAEVIQDGGTGVTLVASDTSFGSDSLTYVASSGEIWRTKAGDTTRIDRYNANTNALLGSIGTGLDLYNPLQYDATNGYVWGWYANKLVRYLAASPYTQTEFTVTNIQGFQVMYNGEIWIYNGTALKQINPSTGAVVETRNPSAIPYVYTLDSSDNLWYTVGLSTNLHKIDSSNVDTFTSPSITGGYPFSDLTYDSERNVLWMGTGNYVGNLNRIEMDGTTVTATINASPSGPSNAGLLTIDYTNDKLYVVNNYLTGMGSGSNRFYIVDLATNTIDNTINTSDSLHGGGSGYTYINYIVPMPDQECPVAWNQGFYGEIYKLCPNCNTTGKLISEIIKEECALVGLSTGDLDTSLITDTVLGYMLTKRSSVRSNLEPLANAFSFDVTESDWVLKFVPRTQSSIRTISESDLACYEADTQIPAIVTGTRGQDLDLPGRIDVNFLRKESDYQIGNQFARRETVNSETSVTLEWPMVLSDSQALYAAQAQMAESWMARQQGEIYVTRKHIDLDPCDVITIPFGGESRTVIIRKKDESRNGLCKIEFQNYDSSVYSGFGTGDGGLTTSQSGSTIIGDSLGVLLDIPALLDTHNDPGKYWAVCNPIPEFTWKGASLYKSNDSGLSYFLLVGQDLQATIGEATSVLGDGRTDIFDETNTVTVSFLSGTPSSTSREAVFNGANAIAIESGSGWEVLQFRTATLVSGTTYTLSGLLRGRRGTEAFTSGHAVGDRVVVLTGSGIARVDGSLAEKGQLRKYKHVTAGQAVIDAYETDFTATCRALIPYSPVQLAGGRDGSGNLSLSWRRRTRLSGEWVDGSDVPLSELTEAYEVEIWDSMFTTLKRTITGLTSPNTTYSAADQTTDFGGTQSTVYVRIYQLSDSVGRGDKLQGSI